jgi:ATP-dependent RNA helicase DeaD
VNFSELTLHPALAAALAARGYELATGVQAAVLDRAVAGRDLLVSSQTGSGKTIAFGAVLAETLLAGARDRATLQALVIVPTRELATQVRGELSWLFAGTGLRLASFTGGTPVGGDLRALERGVDVAIGTPGRLVDLLRRKRLPLGGLKVVVLDEADEMLDLGFREDLETLLGEAPVERQTLLLSATLPSEIRALARRFQRDAVPIDPRHVVGGAAPARAHADIAYVAHLVAAGERLAAVVNILRAADSQRAIVFCTTREAVAGLHAALVARGFAATAISGDRAQAERDRALAQLRGGDMRVLVATNVAARGLDLPDVDLIIHADLPLNAESLTHRSGRTGRAGRKGTAVVIATPAERRKAERLLMSAHVTPAWTPVPAREAIAAVGRERLATEILAAPEGTAIATDDQQVEALVRRLEASGASTDELLRRLLARELARLPGGESVHPIVPPRADGGDRGRDRDRDERRPSLRSRAELTREAIMFRVNLCAKDNADPRWLLPLICRRGGVTRQEVGAIRIGPHETTFEIAGSAARDYAQAAAQVDPRAPAVQITRADAPVGPASAGPKRRDGFAPPRRPQQRPPAKPHPDAKPHRRPAHPAAKHKTRKE